MQYGVRGETGEIDYDEVQRLAETEKPAIIVAGFSAYSRVIDWQRFAQINSRRQGCRARRALLY